MYDSVSYHMCPLDNPIKNSCVVLSFAPITLSQHSAAQPTNHSADPHRQLLSKARMSKEEKSEAWSMDHGP